MPQILKVGFSLNQNSSRFTTHARWNAARRGYDTEGSRCIWQMAGDTRVEAWMQATLAFRWRPADDRGNRICEWFLVPGVAEEELSAALDEVYTRVPADLVGAASADEESRRPPAAPTALQPQAET